MHIIELTELQFKNYSNIHSKKNYKQSVSYAKLKRLDNYKELYLGLVDEQNNVHAATLILEKELNGKFKYGYAPNGYLINFYNLSLLKTFTNELKNYLKQLNYIYLRVNPSINYQVYNSDFILKENNSGILNELKKLDYTLIPNTSKYKMILNASSIDNTYKKFKRSLRRTINDSLRKGITVYEGTPENIDDFLNLLEEKDQKRYQEMFKQFNTPDNKFEFYLAKLEPETYINNYRYLLKKEQFNNEDLNEKLKNPNVSKTKNLIERKMISDKLVTSYNNEIIKGTNILMKYPKGVIISSVGIITNQREVVFVKECYTKEFSSIRSIPVIKWEIIKKSIELGYRKFDLGDVKITKNQITKTGYNGDIIEYSNNFDLIINDMLYKLNGFTNKFNKN